MRRRNYVAKPCASSVSLGRLKQTGATPCYSFQLHARAALAWMKKKRSLRNEKLKAKRVSETEK